MPKKNTAYLSIMLVTAFMGFMLAVQFRVVNRPPGGIPTDRAKELMTELKQVSRENENLSKEIEDLTLKLDQINKGDVEGIDALNSELKKARMAAGLVTVTGSGVKVILDNPDVADVAVPPELSVIQDQDLLSLVNELWGAGANAISINGQRITATTEIRLADPFININTTRVVPPYNVLAIGDATSLSDNLQLPGGLLEYFRDMGFQVVVEEYDDLTIPAYSSRS